MEREVLGKVVNNTLHLCGERERKVITISNPSDEILKLAGGYKTVVYDEQPEYDADTQMLVESYEEADGVIVVHYIVEDIIREEEEYE